MSEQRIEYKTNVSVRLSIPNLTIIDKLSLKRKCSRSEVIEEAVINYIQEAKIAHELEKQ
jgi:metal-responsive CopG/Arc/MetJ family transcriptional regulator